MNNPMRIVTAVFVGATALIIGLGIGQAIDERSKLAEPKPPQGASTSSGAPATPAEQVPEAASAAQPQAANPQAAAPTPPDDQQPSADTGASPEPNTGPAEQSPGALQTPGESAPEIVPMESAKPTTTPNDGAAEPASPSASAPAPDSQPPAAPAPANPPANQQSQAQPQPQPPVQADPPATAPPATPPPAAGQSGGSGLAAQVAAADPTAGEALSRRCIACHTFTKGGAKKIGPNLWGIVGRDVGSVEGFNYSADFGTIDGVWTLDRLATYIQNPKGLIPSTRMIFPGFRTDDELHNLLAYLTTLTDKQSAIDAPRPAATMAAAPAQSAPVHPVADTAEAQVQAPAQQSAPPADDYFGSDWPQGEGRDFVGNMCGSCHSLAIVKQQRLPRGEWDKLLDWMVSEQGMPPLEPDERKTVLDYLTTHFGRG